MPLNVLDCTLRDGGYYNDWDYHPELVEKYLAAIAAAGVDAIEIGFRMEPKDRFLGGFAYSTDAFLETLNLPSDITIGVMIDASELIDFSEGPVAAINSMFESALDSPVSLVRIATHFKSIPICKAAIQRLKELGYTVGLNLMQVSIQTADQISAAAAEINKWGTVDVLYFADSLGNMNSNDIRRTVSALKTGWEGELGIHAHNNKGLALTNTIEAIDCGLTWVDATVLGMGRGAGNTRIEFLLTELMQMNLGKYHAEAVFALVLQEFDGLQKQYQWGNNLLYYLSAVYNIHPTYIQQMLSSHDGSQDQLLSVIEGLRGEHSTSFDFGRLEQAMANDPITYEGTWQATDWAKDRDILIVGAGPWIKDHATDIELFIDTNKPLVICLNVATPLSEDKIDVHATCHAFHIRLDSDTYTELKNPVIAPAKVLPERIVATLGSHKLRDYGFSIEAGRFEAGVTNCIIPKRLAIAYALAAANAGGAKQIYLVGFDGYAPHDPRQEVMSEILKCYQNTVGMIPVTSISPSLYPVPQKSLYHFS
jgi:4-hydroxy 2-oxovalerate aldolase